MKNKERWYLAIEDACAREVNEAVREARFDVSDKSVTFSDGSFVFRCDSLGAALKYLEQLYRQRWSAIAVQAEPDSFELTNVIGAALFAHRSQLRQMGWSLEGV